MNTASLMSSPEFWNTAATPLMHGAIAGAALLLLAGVITLLMRKSSAASRHLVWTLALTALLILPAAVAIVPKWNLAVLPRQIVNVSEPSERAAPTLPAQQTAVRSAHPTSDDVVSEQPIAESMPTIEARTSSVIPPAPSVSKRLPVSAWFVLAWLAGVIVFALPLPLGMLLLHGRIRRSRPIDAALTADVDELREALGLRRPVRVAIAGDADMPMAMGIRRSTILLPSEFEKWPEEKRRAVLLHELAHVARRDCLTHALARVACALHWFNPLAWVALHRMRVERERACDDRVLAAGQRASSYAQHLLEIAQGMRTSKLLAAAAISMAKKSHLEGRLLSILDATRNRGGITRRMVLSVGLLLFAVAIPLATVQLRTRTTPSTVRTEVVVWNAVIDETLARTLIAAATPEPGVAQNYRGHRLTTDKLHAAIRDGSAAGHLILAEERMRWLEIHNGPRNSRNVLRHPNFIGFNIAAGGVRRRLNVMLPGLYETRITDGKLHLGWGGECTAHYGVRTMPDLMGNAGIRGFFRFDGELTGGEGVAYLAPLDGEVPGLPWHVIVIEGVAAMADDAPLLTSLTDLDGWLRGGPDHAMREIHLARKWEANARTVLPQPGHGTLDPSVTRWAVRTSSGLSVDLIAVGQPDRWPHHWWNPDGEPVKGDPVWQKSAGKGDVVLMTRCAGFEGTLNFSTRIAGASEGTRDRGFADVIGYTAFALSPPAGAHNQPVDLIVTFGEGPWEKIGEIVEGATVESGGDTIVLSEVKTIGPKNGGFPGTVAALAHIDFATDYDVQLVATDRTGTRLPVPNMHSGGYYCDFGRQRNRIYQAFANLAKEEIDHFDILRRPLKTHIFTGIAIEPRVPPADAQPAAGREPDSAANDAAPPSGSVHVGEEIVRVLKPDLMAKQRVLDLHSGMIVRESDSRAFLEWTRMEGERFALTTGLIWSGLYMADTPMKALPKSMGDKEKYTCRELPAIDLWSLAWPDTLPADGWLSQLRFPGLTQLCFPGLSEPELVVAPLVDASIKQLDNVLRWPLPFSWVFVTQIGDIGVLEITEVQGQDIHLRYKMLAMNTPVIAGRVTHASTGEPIAGIDVALDYQRIEGTTKRDTTAIQQTDAQGRFSFPLPVRRMEGTAQPPRVQYRLSVRHQSWRLVDPPAPFDYVPGPDTRSFTLRVTGPEVAPAAGSAARHPNRVTDFTAVFAHGVRAELLAAAREPFDGSAWAPDGTHLPLLPDGFDTEYDRFSASSSLVGYHFLVRIAESATETIGFSWTVNGMGGSSAGSQGTDATGAFRYHNLWCGLHPDDASATVRLGIAAGPWETFMSGRSNDSHSASRRGRQHTVIMSGAFAQADKIVAVVSHDFMNEDLRLAAWDATGAMYTAGSSYMGGSNFRQSTFEFHVPGDTKLEKFAFQLRDYEWREIAGVQLHPLAAP